MSSSKCYYFDTNPMVKYYSFKNEKGVEIVRQLVATQTIYISNLTLLEFLNVLMKSFRDKRINKKVLLRVSQQLNSDVIEKLNLIKNPENVFQFARDLMFQYATSSALSTNDALHISIAKLMQVQPIMVTSDRVIKNICTQIQLATFDPEIEEII